METHAEREIIEELHEQLAVLRDQLQSARVREEFLQHLLTADRALDREAALLRLLEADRAELQALRPQRHHIAITHDPVDCPVAPIGASRPPSAELHGRIVEALQACPGGMTAGQLEAALASPKPLADICSGLVRRGVLVRVGAGRFALPAGELVGAVGVNGTGA